MSRFLALWMPFFSTEQLRRENSALYPASRKLVLHATEGNRRVVTAVDASACRAGIGAGMTLAHARALDPDLLVIEHDREQDREALARLTS
ncbi:MULTISPECIES: Y-family DNA polymerase [Asaia]